MKKYKFIQYIKEIIMGQYNIEFRKINGMASHKFWNKR
ncbi:hypothetical protein FACI_IFERC00001G0772 [Ferroplasma acidarmanus Fer1]|uniref:Uncharacterized protein n=1 Tax=Ferroplasma acidarmanus Fer1 TaxID=333146 RepID=S0APS6_FERAC|nr:hypothetical protein FACI_IFERC00001G0772 [Ferroplasma acidarmanus Fer1]